jgi:hypothetical protein
MTDVPPITVGHLKEIWKQHNVSDDDTIEFHFCNSNKNESFDKDFPQVDREIEFEGHIYKRPFGILMEFEPSIIEEDDDEEHEDDEPSDQEMMAAFGTKWHDAL